MESIFTSKISIKNADVCLVSDFQPWRKTERALINHQESSGQVLYSFRQPLVDVSNDLHIKIRPRITHLPVKTAPVFKDSFQKIHVAKKSSVSGPKVVRAETGIDFCHPKPHSLLIGSLSTRISSNLTDNLEIISSTSPTLPDEVKKARSGFWDWISGSNPIRGRRVPVFFYTFPRMEKFSP